MPRIDQAAWPYRARIEAWWWLEHRRLGDYLDGVTYKHRKRAERMALRSLGEWEPPESNFPKPWARR